jgi:hypothetical protein
MYLAMMSIRVPNVRLGVATEQAEGYEMSMAEPTTAARNDAIAILERAMRGELDGARQVLAQTADLPATASELARLLVLLLPSVPAGEMNRFVQTARKFDPLEP